MDQLKKLREKVKKANEAFKAFLFSFSCISSPFYAHYISFFS